jgi:hypothetical protein
MKRSVLMIAGALSVAAFGTAAAADLPLSPPAPQAQAVPPRYAPPPRYYAPPPVEEDEAYPPAVAYDYPPPVYQYAPPPVVVVVPRPYYWGPRYWERPLRGPVIAGGYGYYERPFARPFGYFPERGWGRGYHRW